MHRLVGTGFVFILTSICTVTGMSLAGCKGNPRCTDQVTSGESAVPAEGPYPRCAPDMPRGTQCLIDVAAPVAPPGTAVKVTGAPEQFVNEGD